MEVCIIVCIVNQFLSTSGSFNDADGSSDYNSNGERRIFGRNFPRGTEENDECVGIDCF
jgi:hypothetical protein